MRRVPALLIFVGCLVALAGARPCAAEDARAAQAAWTATLARMAFQASDYEQLQTFVQSDPDMVYSTLRDSWTRIVNVTVRQCLIQLLVNGVGMRMVNGRLGDSYTPNPHLLDILALGLNDPAEQIRSTAAQALGGIAFREIRTPGQLQDWRKEAGDWPLAQLMDAACRASLAPLESPRIDEKANAYRRLLRVPFHSGRYATSAHGVATHGISVSGLVAMRRQAAKGAGLIEFAARGLKPENPSLLRELALRLIAHFGPDEATLVTLAPDIQREAPAVLDKIDANEIYDMLAQMKARWVTDLLIQRIAEVDANRALMSWTAANALGNTGDPRAIPSLIALYDTANPAEFLGQVIERGLCLLTNVPCQFNSGHDGDWWRDWWQEHKQEFPTEARGMKYPQIAGTHRPEGFSLRRHAERRTVGVGVPHDYWLMSPGIITVPSEMVHPGLIVVLSDKPYSPALCKSWQETAGRAWDGRYLVAYIVRPGAAVPHGSAQTPVSDLVTEAVRDARARTTIDPRHVYMFGEGAAGLDVYACSLEKSTPFHGFLLLSSPFRSAQLPSLASAKGRRYYLLHNKADRAAPYILARAAESLLEQQGASVQLTPLEANETTRIPALRQAIQWLETGKNGQ